MDFPFNQFFNDRTDPKTVDVLTRGPLSPHLTEYAQRLHEAGYAIQSGQLQLRVLGHFNMWLDRMQLGADEVDSSAVERYIRSRRKARKLRKGDAATLTRMSWPSRGALSPTDCRADHRGPLSALFATGARIGRGHDYEIHAHREGISG